MEPTQALLELRKEMKVGATFSATDACIITEIGTNDEWAVVLNALAQTGDVIRIRESKIGSRHHTYRLSEAASVHVVNERDRSRAAAQLSRNHELKQALILLARHFGSEIFTFNDGCAHLRKVGGPAKSIYMSALYYAVATRSWLNDWKDSGCTFYQFRDPAAVLEALGATAPPVETELREPDLLPLWRTAKRMPHEARACVLWLWTGGEDFVVCPMNGMPMHRCGLRDDDAIRAYISRLVHKRLVRTGPLLSPDYANGWTYATYSWVQNPFDLVTDKQLKQYGIPRPMGTNKAELRAQVPDKEQRSAKAPAVRRRPYRLRF